MHRNVETLLGRLVTDPTLLRRFAGDPAAVLAELRALGLELTAIEAEALASTDPEAIRRLAAALDRRLRKADLEAARGAIDEPSPPSATETHPFPEPTRLPRRNDHG